MRYQLFVIYTPGEIFGHRLAGSLEPPPQCNLLDRIHIGSLLEGLYRLLQGSKERPQNTHQPVGIHSDHAHSLEVHVDMLHTQTLCQ